MKPTQHIKAAEYFLNNHVQVSRGQDPYLYDKSEELDQVVETYGAEIFKRCWTHEATRAECEINTINGCD